MSLIIFCAFLKLGVFVFEVKKLVSCQVNDHTSAIFALVPSLREAICARTTTAYITRSCRLPPRPMRQNAQQRPLVTTRRFVLSAAASFQTTMRLLSTWENIRLLVKHSGITTLCNNNICDKVSSLKYF